MFKIDELTAAYKYSMIFEIVQGTFIAFDADLRGVNQFAFCVHSAKFSHCHSTV